VVEEYDRRASIKVDCATSVFYGSEKRAENKKANECAEKPRGSSG
jgi:hypothetical protein